MHYKNTVEHTSILVIGMLQSLLCWMLHNCFIKCKFSVLFTFPVFSFTLFSTSSLPPFLPFSSLSPFPLPTHCFLPPAVLTSCYISQQSFLLLQQAAWGTLWVWLCSCPGRRCSCSVPLHTKNIHHPDYLAVHLVPVEEQRNTWNGGKQTEYCNLCSFQASSLTPKVIYQTDIKILDYHIKIKWTHPCPYYSLRGVRVWVWDEKYLGLSWGSECVFHFTGNHEYSASVSFFFFPI